MGITRRAAPRHVHGAARHDIVNVALPTIRDSLDASEATLSWIISGYALAFGLALIPAGRVGDRFGHKWVFFTGLALFTVASLCAGLAQDDTQLIVARVVQGLGGGIFFPAVTAFIQLMFPPMKRGKAFAIMGAVIGVSSALGPIVGGLLIEAFGEENGWRSIFFVNLPIGIDRAHRRGDPAAERRRRARSVDGPRRPRAARRVARRDPRAADPGAGRGLAAVDLPLARRRRRAARAVRLLGACASSRAAGARSCRRTCSRTRRSPAASILALVYFAAFTSIFFTISLLWQAGLGHTALESGLVSIPFAIGSIIGASQSDRLAQRLGRRVLVHRRRRSSSSV